MTHGPLIFFFFFFNDTATTEIYTLSLHDALPISNLCHTLGFATELPSGWPDRAAGHDLPHGQPIRRSDPDIAGHRLQRSEEHTSELQSQSNLVCRLLLEKKNTLQSSTHRDHIIAC